jgi:hypothetical protein
MVVRYDGQAAFLYAVVPVTAGTETTPEAPEAAVPVVLFAVNPAG